MVSHFHVFGCKCFILKKGKKLDKFEARSVDGIFFGYAAHSRAYRVLNLETNQIVETCEVTFDETLVFECAGDDELGEEIFQEEEHEHGDDEDGGVVPPAEHVPTTSTTVVSGVVWTSLGPLPRWVLGPTSQWAPGTTRLALHGTRWREAQGL
jgi:hypothetical protein